MLYVNECLDALNCKDIETSCIECVNILFFCFCFSRFSCIFLLKPLSCSLENKGTPSENYMRKWCFSLVIVCSKGITLCSLFCIGVSGHKGFAKCKTFSTILFDRLDFLIQNIITVLYFSMFFLQLDHLYSMQSFGSYFVG